MDIASFIEMYFTVLLALDAGAMLALGIYDYRVGSAPALVLVPYIAFPLVLLAGLVLWYGFLPVAALIVFVVLFGALILLGIMGLLDSVVPFRLPVLMAPQLTPLGFPLLAVGVLVAYILYYIKEIRPVLCKGGLFFTTALVRREAYLTNPFIFPAGVKVEMVTDEEVEKLKRSAASGGEDCIEAYVGVPYVFIFAVGYFVAVVVPLLTNYLGL